MTKAQLHERLDLTGAAKSVFKQALRDDVPDVIRYRDFESTWTQLESELRSELQRGSYKPRRPNLVEVPKSRLATRPICVLTIRDRVVYEATMQLLVEKIDATLSDEVFSARLPKAKKRKGWLQASRQVQAWVRFMAAGEELSNEFPEACMLTTDITSYFEFIELGPLMKQLTGIKGIDQEATNLLSKLLNSFVRASNVHGIPQGPEVSSILGNLYLQPFDAAVRMANLKFVRFQDDIMIFSNSPQALRKVLRQLNPIVRERHLNLSAAKTKLLEGEDVAAHFVDLEKDGINYGLLVGADDALDDLVRFFDNAAAEAEPSSRDIRFAVHRLRRLKSDHAVPWILENLEQVPYLASLLVEYLADFAPENRQIQKKVRKFLQDKNRNIDPWVELQLVRFLASIKVSKKTMKWIRESLKDQGTDQRVRQFLARALAKNAGPDDLVLLRALYDLSDADFALQRALLVARYEAGEELSSSTLNTIAESVPNLAPVCTYLKGQPQLPTI